jgi:hypothetical protein
LAFLDTQGKEYSLSRLHGRSIGNYEIQLHVKALRYRGGWAHFSLFLKDQAGRISSQRRLSGGWVTTPILEGIHSRGGRGVKGWIEVGDYFPVVYFQGRVLPVKTTHLSRENLDRGIFRLLGECVPPGGHLMFAYEVPYESPLHRQTQEDLMRGFPPISTAQGELLFQAGFRLVKDWYLAEGGHEGPRKLWGEKPFNDVEARDFDLKTFLQLLAFLARQPNLTLKKREHLARRRALAIIEELDLKPDFSLMRQGIIHIYREGGRPMALERAARHTCLQIEDALKTAHFKDVRMRGKLSEISRDCSRGLKEY